MSNNSSLNEQILTLLKENPEQAYNKSEFARALHVAPKDRANLRQAISSLEKDGVIEVGPRARFALTGQGGNGNKPGVTPLTGIIRILGSGHGSVRLDTEHPTGQTYIHIPAGKCGTALTGDHVRATLEKRDVPQWMKNSKKHRQQFEKNAQARANELVGRVTEIIKRADHSLVGTIFKKNGKFYAETDSPSLPNVIAINDLNEAKAGQSVVLKLDKWEVEHLPPIGNVKEILGWKDDAGVDILGIIHRHNLALEFPTEVQQEADKTPTSISSEEAATRFDCRSFPICTIDPHDARDHDDAIWVERLEEGDKHLGWRLQVHIADVSHYVKPDSELDQEALKRGNSTYLVDRVIPMLPTVLSNGLCSLVPDEDRLTKCAVITFDTQGTITKSEFHSAIINSKARLSYENAQEMLDDPTLQHPLADDVRESWKLAEILRKKRFANGALDLEFPEYRIDMNENGKADGYHMNEHTASHKLVEEFMLIANEAVALALKNNKKPSVYRVHEDPDYDKLNEFGEMASILGFKSGDLTSKNELQKLIHSLNGSSSEQSLKLNLLKSLKRATYSPQPLGHYGLAKVNYTHFTSPIRRYADLLVHRSLQSLLQNPPSPIDKVPKGSALSEMADHISTTERTSAEAEMDSKRLKLLEWLDTQAVGGGAYNLKTAPSFEAIVTDVRPLGLMIELKDTMLRGVVKNKDFPPGSWQFDEKKKRYRNTGKGKKEQSIGLADHINIKVKDVDFERLRVDFYLAEEDTN